MKKITLACLVIMFSAPAMAAVSDFDNVATPSATYEYVLGTSSDTKNITQSSLDAYFGTLFAPIGAEANVNADWNAISGDSQILNKPAIPSTPGEVGAEPADATILKAADVEDTPENGSGDPISSNWAFDHAADPAAHGTYTEEAPQDGKLYFRKDGAWQESTVAARVAADLAEAPLTSYMVVGYSNAGTCIEGDTPDTNTQTSLDVYTGAVTAAGGDPNINVSWRCLEATADVPMDGGSAYIASHAVSGDITLVGGAIVMDGDPAFVATYAVSGDIALVGLVSMDGDAAYVASYGVGGDLTISGPIIMDGEVAYLESFGISGDIAVTGASNDFVEGFEAGASGDSGFVAAYSNGSRSTTQPRSGSWSFRTNALGDDVATLRFAMPAGHNGGTINGYVKTTVTGGANEFQWYAGASTNCLANSTISTIDNPGTGYTLANAGTVPPGAAYVCAAIYDDFNGVYNLDDITFTEN